MRCPDGSAAGSLTPESEAVERLASVLALPNPEREALEMRRVKANFEAEAIAMRVVIEHQRAQGRQIYDVSDKNLGYDVTSRDLCFRRTAPHRVEGAWRGDRHNSFHAQ
jgi:hypothetical protein